LQLTGGPRLSVPQRIGWVSFWARLLAGLGRHLGLGRTRRLGPFLFSLFLFHFFFCFSDLFYIFCIFSSILIQTIFYNLQIIKAML
jgi:hypothetical protein